MKYALVTGAAGGLAYHTIVELIKHDFFIFALDLNPNLETLYPKDKVMTILTDLSNELAIQNAFRIILQKSNKLDVVINLAGIVSMGPVIERPISQLKKIFEVNLYAMYIINQEAFPFVKMANGRYINISSEYGILDAIPFHSFYTMSKHAVEIYNDSLRRELKSFNIKVINIRPGAFKTQMQNGVNQQFKQLLNETKSYSKVLLKMSKIMHQELKKAKDPKSFVKVLMKAIISKKPKPVYKVNNSKLMRFISFLPSNIQDKIYQFYFK